MVQLQKIFFGTIFLLLSSCGGGGGGADPSTSLIGAIPQLDVEPGSVALGNLTRVKVRLFEIHPFGAFIKLRFPRQFGYMLDSAFLSNGLRRVAIEPVERERSDAEAKTYVTFLITQAEVGDKNSGELEFLLRATGVLEDGLLEIDVNRHTPGVDPEQEFDIKAPRFSADDSRHIEVRP